MRIKSLAQGNNLLLPGFEPSTSVSKIDILVNRPTLLLICMTILILIDLPAGRNSAGTLLGYFGLIISPTAIDTHSNKAVSFYDSLQLSMQSQHAITFSYVVTSTLHCLSIKFVSKTDAVKLIVTLKCYNHLLSAMTCLLPMHTQGKNTAHFRHLMDQMGARHGLI